MTTQEQQQNQQADSSGSEERVLRGVQVFFYMGQEVFRRYGKTKTIERPLADMNLDLGFNTTVPVTVYPRKFLPVLWSPDQPLSERKFYTVDVRVLEGRNGFYGYAEPSKGSMLLDSEQIPIRRVEGVAIEKLAFKIRGQWWDKTPKFVAYSRDYTNRPVVLEKGLIVNEGEVVPVVLSENIRARPGDMSLVGKLVMRSKQQAQSAIGYTVDVETPTGQVKHGVEQATKAADFMTTKNRVSIYAVLSSQRLGIKADEESRPGQIMNAAKRLKGCIEHQLSASPALLKECALPCFYTAIEEAEKKALEVAIAKFGDNPEAETAAGAEQGDKRGRRRRDRNRNRGERSEQTEGQSAEVSTEGASTEAGTAEAEPTAQATATATAGETTVQESAAPEATTQATAVVPTEVIDERIAAKAAEMKEKPEVVQKAFRLEETKRAARGESLTFDAFLGLSEQLLRFAIRAAKAAK